MNVSEKLEAIKELLGLKATAMPAPEAPEPAATTEQEMSTATAKDGTIMKWNGELAVGVEMICVTPTGDQPCPDGSKEFEDGTIVTTASGKVTEITPAVAAAEEPVVDEIAKLRAEIETLKAGFSKEISELTEQAHSLKEAFTKTVEVVELMNVTPAEPQPKPINALFAKVDYTDRVKQLAERIRQIRNFK